MQSSPSVQKRFQVSRASAGSGKTFNLTRHYLALALQSQNSAAYRNILAITFTRKAAGEMKTRVLNVLDEICDGENPPIVSMLLDDTGVSREVLCSRAQNVRNHMLHNYSDLAISTIDSFVQRILRAFSRELDLPYDFEVELNTERLIGEAVDAVIAQAGRDETLTRALIEFAKQKFEDGKNWNIRYGLINFSQMLTREQSLEYLDGILELDEERFGHLKKKVYTCTRRFEEQVSQHAQKALDLVAKQGLKAEDFTYGKSGPVGHIAHIANGDMSRLYKSRLVDYCQGDKNWYAESQSEAIKSAISGITERLKEILAPIFPIRDSDYEEYSFCRRLRPALYPMYLLGEVARAYRQIAHEQNLVPISEFNSKVAEVVKDEPTPFIYERVGERYRYIMIDEFQDTSVLQWSNFLPLVEESLSRDGSVFLVGDAKQAIYRFRNGDVEQFADLPELTSSRLPPERTRTIESLIKQMHAESSAGSNWRSSPTVVKFNNTLFTAMVKQMKTKLFDFSKYYKDLGQEPKRSFKGYVEVRRYDSKEEDEKTTKVIRQINQCLNSGFRPGNITVLVRKKDSGNRWARTLKEAGFQVSSADSLLLDRHPAIKLLIAFLRAAAYPEDEEQKFEVASLLLDHMDMEPGEKLKVLAGYRKEKKSASGRRILWLHLDEFISERFDVNVNELLSLPLYPLCELLCSKFNLYGEADEYLLAFLDIVDDFANDAGKINKGVAGFITWWDMEKAGSAAISPSESLDAIRIMTMHKSKGLEFPVVIMPESGLIANRDSEDWIKVPWKNEFPHLWVYVGVGNEQNTESDIYLKNEELKRQSVLDEFNVLYVGCTRAVQRLYLHLSPKRGRHKELVKELNSCFETLDAGYGKKGVIARGDPQSAAAESKPVSAMEPLAARGYDWRHKIPTATASAENWREAADMEAIQIGNSVHEILSRIQEPGDAKKIVDEVQRQGSFDDSLRQAVEYRVMRMLEAPQTAEFFHPGWRVAREQDIVVPGDDSWKRPDRILIDGSKAIVIDFKTGTPSESHRVQVNGYLKLLLEMGYSPVLGYLVYTNDQVNVVPVEEIE